MCVCVCGRESRGGEWGGEWGGEKVGKLLAEKLVSLLDFPISRLTVLRVFISLNGGDAKLNPAPHTH